MQALSQAVRRTTRAVIVVRCALPVITVLQFIASATAPLFGQPANVHIQVVSASDNEPIRRAHVSITTTQDTIELLTGDDGRLDIPAVAPSDRITISRPGFLPVPTDSAALAGNGFLVRLIPAAVIEGRVVSPSGRPAVVMAVELSPVGGTPGAAITRAKPVTVFTNDLGEFRASGLSAGRYRVRSYLDFDERERMGRDDALERLLSGPTVGVAETRSNVVDVDVEAGEQASLMLTLSAEYPFSTEPRSQGVISGVVTDRSGDPVEGARVRLWHPTGTSRLLRQSGPAMTTDDRGRYRLFARAAGVYFVEVRASSTSADAGAPTYYPDAAVIGEARAVRSNGATELSGVDLVTRPRRLARVRGVVSASSDLTGGEATLAHDPGEGHVRLPSLTTRLDKSGAFTFDQVPPGNYLLRVVAYMPLRDQVGNAPEAAVRAMAVGDDDPPPIQITTSPTPVLRGRVVVDGDAEPVPDGLLVGYRTAGIDSADARSFLTGMPLDRSGTFGIVGLTGPVLLTLAGPSRGWWLKSIRAPAAQSPEEPITATEDEITLVIAHSAATLSGRILAAAGTSSDVGTTVVLFPADQRRWDWVRFIEPTPDGQFTSESLRPGAYYVVALAHATDHPDWDDLPAFLTALASIARRVTLSEGQTLGLDLRVTDALH